MSLTCLLTGGAELKMTSFRSVMRSRSSGFGGPSISASSGLGVDFSAVAEDGGLAVGGSNRSYFRTRLREHAKIKINRLILILMKETTLKQRKMRRSIINGKKPQVDQFR